MHCNALSLVPKTDNLVVVGWWVENWYLTYWNATTLSLSAGNDPNLRAFLLYTTPDLKVITARYWFNSDTY